MSKETKLKAVIQIFVLLGFASFLKLNIYKPSLVYSLLPLIIDHTNELEQELELAYKL